MSEENKMSARRSRLIAQRCIIIALAVTFLFALSGCGKIVVTGRVRARPDSGGGAQDIVSLSVTRGNLEAATAARLVTFQPGGVDRVWRDLTGQLRSDITNNPSQLGETYHFVALFRSPDLLSGGTSNDRSFVLNHIGGFFHFAIAQDDPPRESTKNGRWNIGAAWLAAVPQNSRVIPWHIEPGSQNCFPLGNACFDMENLTHRLFNAISNGISNSFSPSGIIVERLHFVPHVIHQGLENAGRKARGVGFLFFATVEVPTATVDVVVPISIVFLNNVNDYLIVVDPLSFGPTDNPGSENLNRVFVRGSFPANLAEGPIRDSVVSGIRSAQLPEIIAGIPFETALLTAINGAAGLPHRSGQPPTISPQYEVILLPDDTGSSFDSAVVWEKFRGFDEHSIRHVHLVFLE
jgi:hypothetical protein